MSNLVTQHDLAYWEGIVEQGMQKFWEVGHALSVIRRQFPKEIEKHGGWTQYLRQRWKYSVRWAQELMQAAEVHADMKGRGITDADSLTVKAAVKASRLEGEDRVVGVLRLVNQQSAQSSRRKEQAKAKREEPEEEPWESNGFHPEVAVAARRGVLSDPKPEPAPEPKKAKGKAVQAPAGIVDDKGNRVPQSLRGAFEGATQARQKRAEIQAIVKWLKEWGQGPAAAWMGQAPYQGAITDLKNAADVIDHYRPAVLCPKCAGERPDGCKTCLGRGFLHVGGVKK